MKIDRTIGRISGAIDIDGSFTQLLEHQEQLDAIDNLSGVSQNAQIIADVKLLGFCEWGTNLMYNWAEMSLHGAMMYALMEKDTESAAWLHYLAETCNYMARSLSR